MNSFIEVTDKKSNEKILINTMLIVDVRGNCITTTLGFTIYKYKTLETYEEIIEKLAAK
ncbi:hypothetical protein M3212_08560 [Alkalihalobacillus oceani]|uniref:hypothetical protein n=1 Tax=Halalkalibacter oceani TaxID=1653776 RepID=UPI00203F4AEB|nr:hypothetical protein [Halalkalibacter oceani]MCM3760840.1 hypothetical protein [Halalkalibacter oceani]